MTNRVSLLVERARQRLSALAARSRERLEWWGLLPPSIEAAEELEDRVQVVLKPVSPSPDFRAGLANNLQFAAQHKLAGLAVEYPRPFREGILLGVSAGLLAAAVTITVLVLRSRPAQAD